MRTLEEIDEKLAELKQLPFSYITQTKIDYLELTREKTLQDINLLYLEYNREIVRDKPKLDTLAGVLNKSDEL